MFDLLFFFFFFFNDTATTEIYTLSLHDALPIYASRELRILRVGGERLVEVAEVVDGLEGAHIRREVPVDEPPVLDRKSTRLNSSHLVISYAVFCLKKKKKNK